MSKVKFDLRTAQHMMDAVDKGEKQFRLVECESCGALYLTGLGHHCEDKVITVESHEAKDGDEIEQTD